MEEAAQTLSNEWQALIGLAPRVVSALIVLLAFYLAGRSLAAGFSTILGKVARERIHESFCRTFIVLVCVYFGIVIALNIVGLERLALSILAGGGVTAVVIGFAFREIGENLIAGVFLAFSRPFSLGDLVNTEGFEGRVKAIELRYTHLRADDGRDLFIPSAQLFSKPVVNYTRDGLRRFMFKVGIDYANDAKAACDLLRDTVESVPDVLTAPAPNALINALEPGYVELVVFYWQNTFDVSVNGGTLRIAVMDACRRALLDNGYTVSSETTTNVCLSGNATGNVGCGAGITVNPDPGKES